jgi:hypothetical protein
MVSPGFTAVIKESPLVVDELTIVAFNLAEAFYLDASRPFFLPPADWPEDR